MYHWIRDCAVPSGTGTENAAYGECSFLIYHFLRTAGWTWIWECDGTVDNHCPDASMEASGVTSWTVVGTPSITKTTATKNMGNQALSVASTALNDGVRSAALTSMSASTTYYLSIWSSNGTGSSWNVEVDVGGGSFASVGSIPDNSGVWTRYEFSFTTDGSANPRYFRVIDNNGSTATIYLDSVVCYKSFYEHNGVDAEDLSITPDGQILNNDEFSSASYTFVTGDVGKYICVWDTTNLGNSGVYEITSISSGNAVMDLRAGGTPALASQTGLRWRMCDVSVAARAYRSGVDEEVHAGWGLESPHSEKWRLFTRNNEIHTPYAYTWLVTWSCPYDGDFDVEDGQFYGYVASSTEIFNEYVKGDAHDNGAKLVSALNPGTAITYQRLYLQTDDDGTALFIALRPGTGASLLDITGHVIIGFSGADSYHTLRESFIHYGNRYSDGGTNVSTMQWGSTNQSGFVYGAQCSSTEAGYMLDSKMPIRMVGTNNTHLQEYSVPRVNPFSGERWVSKFTICRDYFGYNPNEASEKTLDTLGLYISELITDANYLGVDSNTMFHFRNGVYMELPSSLGVGLFTPLA